MSEIYFPYKTLEEKQGILDANTDKAYLREEMIGPRQFVVYDDGAAPPFDIPDRVIKAAFGVVIDELNEIRTKAAMPTKTAADFIAAVKAKLGI